MKIHEKLNWAKIYKELVGFFYYKPSDKIYLLMLINCICMISALTLFNLGNYYNSKFDLIAWFFVSIQWVCIYKQFKL